MTTKTAMKLPKINSINDLRKVPASALPRKLSATIRVALNDLKKVENSKRFSVDMGSWFSKYQPNRPCHVCFAGAVMANTLKLPLSALRYQREGMTFYNEVHPGSFNDRIRDKLKALNCVRSYNISRAVDTFYGVDSPQTQKYNAHDRVAIEGFYPAYEEDPEAWHRNMLRIADHLESIGL